MEILQELWGSYKAVTGMMYGSLPAFILFLISVKFLNRQEFLECGDTSKEDKRYDLMRMEKTGEMPGADFNDPFQTFLFATAYAILWPLGLFFSGMLFVMGLVVLMRRTCPNFCKNFYKV